MGEAKSSLVAATYGHQFCDRAIDARPAHSGNTPLFENDRVRVWSMTVKPHGVFDFSSASTITVTS
jgi:hypothetical protein